MSHVSTRPTILVTGGAGFIGANFVKLLLEETDARIVNLDALTYAGSTATVRRLGLGPRHDFVRGRIEDQSQIRRLLWMYEPTAIVNLAAETHVDRSIDDSRPFLDSNVIGTHTLLQTVYEWWRELSAERSAAFRLLHVSTDEVYGSMAPGCAATEDSPHRPSSPYSATKAAAEHLMHAWHVTYGLPTIVTRCSNNYGPFQFPEKLIPVMIRRARAGLSLPIYGDGSQERDWIHVDDHARALLRVLEAGRIGAAYNIGGSAHTTNRAIVERICAELDQFVDAPKPHGDLIRNVVDRPGHDTRYAIDCSKITTELGWRPQVEFEEGLKRTVAWYLENDAWCSEVTRSADALRRRGQIDTAPTPLRAAQ